MSPLEKSSIIFLCIFSGAALGMVLRNALPEHHLNAETKDLIKLGVGLVGTMAALLLGLLVASAKSAYDAKSTELTQMAASVIWLDRTLAHYGPETAPTRATLKAAVSRFIDQLWPRDNTQGGIGGQTGGGEIILDKVEELAPKTEAQRSYQSQAQSLAMNIGQMRWLLFEQSGSAISTPFLVVVVFWLTTLFVSFGMFAPRNATAFFVLIVSALSVAGAIYLILELDHPFSGLIQIPPMPLRNALRVLGQ